MSKQRTYDRVTLLGVEVDVITLAEATNYLIATAADPRTPAGYVIKPYVEFLDRASTNPKLAALLNDAELSVADGVAVVWAAHYLYAGPRTLARFLLTLSQIIAAPAELCWPLPERAAGTNFTWQLLRTAAEKQLRVALIGKETAADIGVVASTITAALPSITIVSTIPGRDPNAPRGHVTPSWTDATARQLLETKPDLILVGMGFPLQEHVCADLVTRLPHGLLIGEGGTFDYESFGGPKRKAPPAIQRIGLEWLWRLALEPTRLRRQFAIPRFIAKVRRTH
ncbi:MAG TPA: WecB/TagA/CpsF family glycosyltransferase [Candidatus Saccharimonadia bacterium]|nr:WecB/TagA/CpsF family glycosyltransferase [Candidatus Saccharimonadia bacterium]